MIAANRIGSAPGSRATDIISGADGGTLVLSRTRCPHYAASRWSPPDAAWPGRRPSLIPSRRARAPYRGTRENNLPTPPCREPPTPLIRGHFFHPPLVRGRCLYPPNKGGQGGCSRRGLYYRAFPSGCTTPQGGSGSRPKIEESPAGSVSPVTLEWSCPASRRGGSRTALLRGRGKRRRGDCEPRGEWVICFS